MRVIYGDLDDQVNVLLFPIHLYKETSILILASDLTAISDEVFKEQS